ncbi:hypothetical protein [Ruminococcus sp.]|uniref:hypothetical protein n=1 Tax=Ruminococcus sp. TaxID=41978 RepID=UPI0025DEF3EE|nr:hypothetical protein [Ruminococcus sp.]MBQ8965966.1 hypothetical protein [Ruminococcus sp.]
MKAKVISLVGVLLLAAAFSGCGGSPWNNDDDLPPPDESHPAKQNEFEVKEGTYQKKNGNEKIVIIDQKHFQFVDFDYDELLQFHADKFQRYGWEPPADGAEKLKEVNEFTTMTVEDQKLVSTEIFDDLIYHVPFVYYDDDGYTLEFRKEEYILTENEE